MFHKIAKNEYKEQIYSWLDPRDPFRDFNFGHEHPDAGSFVYFPEPKISVVTPRYKNHIMIYEKKILTMLLFFNLRQK